MSYSDKRRRKNLEHDVSMMKANSGGHKGSEEVMNEVRTYSNVVEEGRSE